MIQPRECGVMWPLGWLATYSGSDCRLWRLIYQKCVESKICRETLALLPSIGINITKHKCYDPALIDNLEQATNQSSLKTPQQAKHAT
jgi:hypothetical protein